MKLFLITMIVSLGFSSISFAAPKKFEGYCSVLTEGDNESVELNLNLNDEEAIVGQNGDVVYTIQYADLLFGPNVLVLKALDTKLKKQSVTVLHIDSAFPKQIDHVSNLGLMTCGLK